MNEFAARRVDETAFYVKDLIENVLHGAEGGPFPYQSKATAASVAARRNGRFGLRRFVVVTWLREIVQ